MAVEIERKFVVAGDSWRAQVTSASRIVQGYLASTGRLTLRVRIKGERAYLTVKGTTSGISRSEFEYEIPVADAQLMLDELAEGPVIDKVRHLVPVGDHLWEVDEFAGANAPLVMAEIELSDPAETFVRPEWAALEVSADPRYYNANLAVTPYSSWAGN